MAAESDVRHLHAHFGTNSAEVAMLVHVLGGPPGASRSTGRRNSTNPNSSVLPEKIRRAAFVVAVSSFGRSQLFRLVEHQQWNKIHVVRCGLEPAFFDGRTDLPQHEKSGLCWPALRTKGTVAADRGGSTPG